MAVKLPFLFQGGKIPTTRNGNSCNSCYQQHLCPSLNFQMCIYTTARAENLLKRAATTNLHLHLGEAATEENTAGAGINPLTRCCEDPQGREQGKDGSRKGRRGMGRENRERRRRAERENRERWRGAEREGAPGGEQGENEGSREGRRAVLLLNYCKFPGSSPAGSPGLFGTQVPAPSPLQPPGWAPAGTGRDRKSVV